MIGPIRERLDPLIQASGAYHEIFVGGGPILLDIAADRRFEHVNLAANDLDHVVAAFWDVLANAPDDEFNELLALVNRKPTIEMFWAEREREKLERDRVTLAYHCVFFHKTTFNGMYRALPIGGRSQKSKWTVGCHYTPANIVKKLTEARRRVYQRLAVTSVPAIECIASIPDGEALYLDPPYFTVGHLLYPVAMTHLDHCALADALKTRTAWVLSYDNCDAVRDLYTFARVHEIQAWYASSSFNEQQGTVIVNPDGSVATDDAGNVRHRCMRKTELLIEA